eukprot:TRINITY_DN72562_c0_g1_i1.p1 TRINITY_DN72562_c0_g1~~TRINITY_DN72562_c0_g1_i1.p1  ORF type:complete len:274 (-),score=16.40 TRINITY_DN72562_c0_g1_i1:45-866(-)
MFPFPIKFNMVFTEPATHAATSVSLDASDAKAWNQTSVSDTSDLSTEIGTAKSSDSSMLSAEIVVAKSSSSDIVTRTSPFSLHRDKDISIASCASNSPSTSRMLAMENDVIEDTFSEFSVCENAAPIVKQNHRRAHAEQRSGTTNAIIAEFAPHACSASNGSPGESFGRHELSRSEHFQESCLADEAMDDLRDILDFEVSSADSGPLGPPFSRRSAYDCGYDPEVPLSRSTPRFRCECVSAGSTGDSFGLHELSLSESFQVSRITNEALDATA